jgi:hypothetical protein
MVGIGAVKKALAVPKAVWKILRSRNFPSQQENAVSLLENLYTATSKE